MKTEGGGEQPGSLDITGYLSNSKAHNSNPLTLLPHPIISLMDTQTQP